MSTQNELSKLSELNGMFGGLCFIMLCQGFVFVAFLNLPFFIYIYIYIMVFGFVFLWNSYVCVCMYMCL